MDEKRSDGSSSCGGTYTMSEDEVANERWESDDAEEFSRNAGMAYRCCIRHRLLLLRPVLVKPVHDHVDGEEGDMELPLAEHLILGVPRIELEELRVHRGLPPGERVEPVPRSVPS